MASELRVNTLKDAAGSNSVAMTYVANGSAKGWIHFDGSDTTPAANDSLNHSSILDNAVGDYSLTHANAYSSTEYGILLTGGRYQAGNNVGGDMTVDEVEPTTTVARINSWRNTNSAGESVQDAPNITAAFFGSLA